MRALKNFKLEKWWFYQHHCNVWNVKVAGCKDIGKRKVCLDYIVLCFTFYYTLWKNCILSFHVSYFLTVEKFYYYICNMYLNDFYVLSWLKSFFAFSIVMPKYEIKTLKLFIYSFTDFNNWIDISYSFIGSIKVCWEINRYFFNQW